MLQFCQAVQQSPTELTDFVYSNLNNSAILHLISQQQFLTKLNLRMTRVDQAQFFLKNVFKIIREPFQDQLQVLKIFVQEACNQNYRDIAINMINGAHLNKQGLVDILHKIEKGLKSGHIIQVQSLLESTVDPQCQKLMSLLRYIHEQSQERQWNNKNFRKRLLQLTKETFNVIQQKIQYSDSFLLIFSMFIHQSLIDQKSEIYLTLLLQKLIEKYKKQAIKIIKNLISFDKNLIFPNIFVSRGIFHLFVRFFDTETYYDQENTYNLNQIEQLARQFYEILKEEIDINELGWLTIFSIDKIVFLEQFQQMLHVCASILRQAYNGRADIISEIYTLVVCNYIQKVMIQDSITKIQSLLTMLTPSQLKYLIFKLNNILSQGKKLQMIEQVLKNQNKTMNVCIIYFINQLGEKIVSRQAVQFGRNFRDQYQTLNEQIQIDRYNTYQKQLQHFIKWHLFEVKQQLGLFPIKKNVKFSSLLNFYKHLFQYDYFAQQFWVNEQKMKVFVSSDDTDLQRIQIFCEFQKYPNLSNIMLLTLLLKRLSKNLEFPSYCIKTITFYIEKSISVIQQDEIPSNLIISFEYLLTVIKNNKIRIDNFEAYLQRLISIFNESKWKSTLQSNSYGRFNFNIEYLLCKIFERNKEKNNFQTYMHLLPIYKLFSQNKSTLNSNNFSEKMIKYYLEIGLFINNNNFSLRELKIKQQLKDIICNYPEILSLKLAVKKSSEYFTFQSPIYKQQIVTFTYFSNDPNDNYYFKNHYLTFLYQEYLKVFTKAVEKCGDRVMASVLFEIIMNLLEEILEGDTSSHSSSFYKSLIKTQNVYILLSKQILSMLDYQKLQAIFEKCVHIIEKDNYPLLRQFLEVFFCRTYLILNNINPLNKNRKMLMSMLKVNVNVGVPIALTLGYDLLQFYQSSNKNVEINSDITEIHQILVKFISCHTAYLRGICQYYLYIYLKIVPPTDPFLINISSFWSEDKDSQKILANISTVVQGFKEAVEGRCDFLGFERVEEYPSNRVKLQFYRSAYRFYSESILGQINHKQNVSSYFYNAYCDSAKSRSKQLKNEYLSFLELYLKRPIERCHKNNMKIKKQEQVKVKVQKNEKAKKQSSKKSKGKNKLKNNNIKQEQIEAIVEQDENIIKFQNTYQIFTQIDKLINWNRSNLNPKVIVIATLLEKVHNFGHILRTLHGKNALLIMPSNLPLGHPECRQLIPQNCDVQVAQVKQRDLQKFIILMKTLGYPLVALQQCSRSVKVEQAVFPQKFILLLGNERLGAPATFLNEADLLVEIPQVGKIRSLNVHVSMVLCLWQYLIKQK